MAPTITTIEGIRVCVYSREHRPAHVHVMFAEFEMTIDIHTLEILSGKLPPAKANFIKAWIRENQELLKSNFASLNPAL